jgi:predicted MFS family arabinose efflux permease
MYVIVFLQGLVFYGAISTVYRQARGLSMAEIFLIESVSWILMLLLEVPWGWFADRFGYKRTLIIANFVFFASKIVFFAAASFPMFLLERVLLSVALSGLSGCDITLLFLSKAPEASSERMFARYRWCSASGLLAASLLSPLILKTSMEATTFLTMIPYGLAFAATLFLIDIKGNHEEKPSIRGSFRVIAKNGKFLLFVASAALLTEAVQSVTVFLNQPQYQRSGLDITWFGPLLALMQVIRLITVKSHVLSGRFGRLRSIGGLLAVILLACTGLILTASPVVSILLMGLISGSMALCEPMIIDEQNSSIVTGDRATILSVYSMGGSVIAAAVNPVIGVAADGSAPLGLAVCAGLAAAAGALLLVYIRKTRKRAGAV